MTKPEDIEARVHQVIRIQLGIDADKIKREDSFVVDYGADSLDTVELVMHKDAASFAGFERIVTLVEQAHYIGITTPAGDSE